ncbi:MAG: hypothetical protein DMF77_02445 [Acidobacteria bacterium]|nr:MAG: hypothetical protein DMF77_02445 [Acidobacteriota bacterium]
MPKPKRVSTVVEDRFLDAAARLFRAKGFEATTVREIAKAARMLPGSLHYRYPTKDRASAPPSARRVTRWSGSVWPSGPGCVTCSRGPLPRSCSSNGGPSTARRGRR